jgi:hypothetical protein
MINKITLNKLYIASTLLLCILTYLLNYCTAIYGCALVFTIIVITVNATTVLYGRFKGLIGLSFAAIISFALLWKLPYYIDGSLVNGLVIASFSSLIVSLYFSSSALTRFYSRFGFVITNALSLGIAAIIDGFIMGLFFVINNNFSYARIMDTFNRELSYKMFYGILASFLIFTIIKILQKGAAITEYKRRTLTQKKVV